MKWHTALCLVFICSVSTTLSCVDDFGNDGWDDWGGGDFGGGIGGFGDGIGGGGLFDDGLFDDGSFISGINHVNVEEGGLGGGSLDSTRFFFGVPYAAPPVGDLRWRAPQPYEGWTGTREATSYGARCVQPATGAYGNDKNESEDCLFMNVWAPEKPASNKLPVMVWIHGGDHISGSASDPLPDGSGQVYDGAKLAAKGVVVASFNYRLGALGFFPHPDLKSEDGIYGNQGLWDQTMALKWIKKNIKAFGGDPNNITIFGQGSGAQDVCYHMVSPASRGLFNQAIGESGGCTDYQYEEQDLLDGVYAWMNKLRCDKDKSVLKCLRNHKPEEVIAAMPKDSPFRPFVDGSFLKGQPRDAFDRGDIANAAYILGNTTNEGSAYQATYGNVESEADYQAILQANFPPDALKGVADAYPGTQYAGDAHPYAAALSHVFGDARVVCPTWDTAQRAYEIGNDVYVYNFDDSTASGGGTKHGAELGYVFGSGKLNGAQQTLSDLIQKYWTNFAGFGDPNDTERDSFQWPAYSARAKSQVNLASDMKLTQDTHDTECALWRSIYAQQLAKKPAATTATTPNAK
jgi:para-nitrobenzyl esterase